MDVLQPVRNNLKIFYNIGFGIHVVGLVLLFIQYTNYALTVSALSFLLAILSCYGAIYKGRRELEESIYSSIDKASKLFVFGSFLLALFSVGTVGFVFINSSITYTVIIQQATRFFLAVAIGLFILSSATIQQVEETQQAEDVDIEDGIDQPLSADDLDNIDWDND